MVSKEQVVNRLKKFMYNKVNEIAADNQLVMIFRPLVYKVGDKMIEKVDGIMGLIADDKGMVDVDKLMTEMIDNLIAVTNNTKMQLTDGICIGDGEIHVDIPLIEKTIVFTKDDLNELKKFVQE